MQSSCQLGAFQSHPGESPNTAGTIRPPRSPRDPHATKALDPHTEQSNGTSLDILTNGLKTGNAGYTGPHRPMNNQNSKSFFLRESLHVRMQAN